MTRHTASARASFLLVVLLVLGAAIVAAQTTTATLEGRVLDSTGAVVPGASITAQNVNTGLARTTISEANGDYRVPLLPVGEYNVTVEKTGFQKSQKRVLLSIGQNAAIDFALAVGEIAQEVDVEAQSDLVEPTRTSVSSVITTEQIESLPVNGRQFIDFALLAPGVSIGETTSGSTDVIIEPVTKLSFAGQNIHFNFIALDGADNISTASGIHKTSPSQEAVKEFQVINTQYGAEAGRAVGGIVNVVTKSGTNDWHGSAYWYFRDDALDATSILASPGLDELSQHQLGFTLGGPVRKDKTFIFGNYELQRRDESPFYNSVVLNNIGLINTIKANFGLAQEDLNQERTTDYDNFFVKLDHLFNDRHYMFVRYFLNDQRALNLSPLNDGFDLPSTFRNNFFRDQSLAGVLTSTLSPRWVNELRAQFARRSFDFPAISAEPHLEVANTFTMGVNRGNPDFYKEHRFEVGDNVTWNAGRHTVSFGGNYNWVRTTESFPLFYPFEATFACLRAVECPFSLEAGSPFVIFFQRNDTASNFTEPQIIPGGTSVFTAEGIPQSIRDQAKGTLDHTYNGFFIQDKWRMTDTFTLNFGLRWEFETWPDNVLNTDYNNFDPRVGFAWALGSKRNFVIRGGAGIFRGTIPSPLLMCQIPSCGGVQGEYPGREDVQNELNATTRLFAFASDPFITNLALSSLLSTGTYPDATPAGFCPDGTLGTCGFLGDAVIVRFAKDHEAPYGIQTSLSAEFEPFKDSVFRATFLHVRGVRLGSFYNVNQPDPTGQVTVHDSQGNTGTKNTFFAAPFIPGTRDPRFAVYFEADSLWDSVYDGLLLDFDKRPSNHFGFGASYTWSKGIDNGPNPSFVLIPQDNTRFHEERAVSSDHLAHRFVANATILGPTKMNALVNDWEFGFIVTLQSPRYFTKFAGFDANGDIFGANDRVGIEPRNTFEGDSMKALDLRVSRGFNLSEKVRLQGMFEAFNVFNTLNVRFFNTTYGAADFCNVSGPLDPSCGAGPFFLEGSPNPAYGTPRAIFNPRQLQLAVRLTF